MRYPKHSTEGYECWCRPSVYVVCPECGGKDGGCWACDHHRNGLKLVHPPYSPDKDHIIVHNDPVIRQGRSEA